MRSDERWKVARRCGANHIWKSKAHQRRTTFGSCDVEKVHAIVERSTFGSQSAQRQSTSVSEHVWKVRCRKIAPRCGAKHISKSKCTKHTMLGNWDVEKVHAIVALSTFRSQKWKKLRGTDHFWTFRCRFAWQAQGILHLAKSEQNVCGIFKSVGRRGTFEEDP